MAVERGIEAAGRGGLQASWAQGEGRTVAGRRPKSPERRVDSPALFGKGSRTFLRASG